MDKSFNHISLIGGAAGGILSFLFGGWDMLLKALVALVVLDYITGIIKAIYTKTLSSEIGFKGLLKKIMIFMVISLAVIIQSVIGDNIPLRDIVITFFICNEGLSLLENAAMFIPIPDKLKNTLLQLRDSDSKKK